MRFLSEEKLSDEFVRGLLPSNHVILEAGLDPLATHSNSDFLPAERVRRRDVILASTGFTEKQDKKKNKFHECLEIHF